MASVGSAAKLAAAALLFGLAGGCASETPPIGYYAQAVGGHLDLLQRARPISQWLADASTPADLRTRLALAQRLRDFAVAELALPDNASYRSYAVLDRPAAVWNVVAAPELSLTLESWCFPVLGCVGYRGYFERAAADALARRLQARGLEVSVYGVPAYSTLGWSNWLGGDPLLSTFIGWPETELAGLVFHELAHQLVYAADDTMFNESFATTVERLGQARWRAAHAATDAATAGGVAAEDALRAQRRADFRALTGRARAALERLYRSALPDADKRAAKAALMAALRAEHAALKAGAWAGFDGYDDWFAHANNASLALQNAYDALVPDFERLFEREGRDFPRFYAAVRRLAALPRAERRATLQTPP